MAEHLSSYQALPQEVHQTQKGQAWPAPGGDQQVHNSPDLIRASRGVNKAVQPYKMEPPWGQPEPADRQVRARPSAGVGLTGYARKAGSRSPDTAGIKHDSLDATEPDMDQGRRRQSHCEAATSVGDQPNEGAWQQPAYQNGSSRNENLPSRRGSATETDIHPSSNPGKPALRAGAHQQPSSWWSPPRMDSLASDGVMAARGSGEDPAGLSNRHGSEQQEHQHTLQRPSAELESSSGVNSGTGYANSVPAARPYATEQSLKAMIQASQDLEDKLMKLNQEKAELEAEYARMPSHAGRNLKDRKRKTDIEGRFQVIDHDVNSLRLQLKRLGLK
ncbi:hypothetical protein ABBQ38_008319 [Trebouxia sp. C0009 RCD-2024]